MSTSEALRTTFEPTDTIMRTTVVVTCNSYSNTDNTNNNNLQAFQLIVVARYLLGVPKP